MLVLGAGIQGVCVALALARRGCRVTLVDEAAGCLLRASLRQEGKVHLGLVYANDPTRRTPVLMLDAALDFGSVLDGLVGRPLPWASLRSNPFHYGVLRESLVPFAELEASYERLQASLESIADGRPYLGSVLDRVWWPADPSLAGVDPALVPTVVATPEVAVDLDALRSLLVAAVDGADGITTCLGHRVLAGERRASGFAVSGVRDDGSAWAVDADAVVNCLWSGRFAVDATVGVAPTRPWVHRLKHRVLGRLAPSVASGLPSFTFVLGPYGDVVVGDGRPTYLSWYPACATGWSTSVSPPPSWSDPVPEAEAASIAAATVRGLAALVPALAGFEPTHVDAGVIVAWGESDIDRADSRLHERHEIGVTSHDGWLTVDTGKFTTAPRFALDVAAVLAP